MRSNGFPGQEERERESERSFIWQPAASTRKQAREPNKSATLLFRVNSNFPLLLLRTNSINTPPLHTSLDEPPFYIIIIIICFIYLAVIL